MFGILLVAIIILGFVLGKLSNKIFADSGKSRLTISIGISQNISIFILLFMMGYKIASNKELIAGFSKIGLHSLLFGVSALLGSVLLTWALMNTVNKIHLKKRKAKLKSHVSFIVEENKSSQSKNILMIVLLLLCVIIGGFAGYYELFILSDNILTNLIDFSLMALIFFIGIDMGLSQLNFEHLKSVSKSSFLICLGVVFGSFAGTVLVGKILGYNLLFSAAIGSPMGWYSLAGIIFSKINEELGAIAFSANLVRELLAIALVPAIGLFSKEGAIAACGATAMDTTLPSITKGLGKQYAVTAFACGIIISSIVPFFLSIIQIIYGIM